MPVFSENFKLEEWFGDLGGSVFGSDFDDELKRNVSEIEKVLKSETFEKLFNGILKNIFPDEIQIKTYDIEGRKIMTVPSNGKYYIIAGQLALARIFNKNEIFVGSYSGELLITAAEACKKEGFKMTAILSEKLSSDIELRQKLKLLGCTVDAETCVSLYDFPERYAASAASSKRIPDSPAFEMCLTANSGNYPQPSLVGSLAAIYGIKLRQMVKDHVDCIVTPILDGTEAISIFKAFENDDVKKITIENKVAQEYHNGETILTRSADHEENNMTLCPELVNWWRMGKVKRLGCDRVRPVDTKIFNEKGIGDTTARALAITVERFEDKRILVLEGCDESNR